MTEATSTIDISFFSPVRKLPGKSRGDSLDLLVLASFGDGSQSMFSVDSATCPDDMIQRILDEGVELGDYEAVARARLEKLFANNLGRA